MAIQPALADPSRASCLQKIRTIQLDGKTIKLQIVSPPLLPPPPLPRLLAASLPLTFLGRPLPKRSADV